MLTSVVKVMRGSGMDSEDVLNGLTDDLEIIECLMGLEE